MTPVLLSVLLIGCATTASTTTDTTTERAELPEKDSLRVGALLEPELWSELSFDTDKTVTKVESGTWVSVLEAKKLSSGFGGGTVFYRLRAGNRTGWVQSFFLSDPKSYHRNKRWADSLREKGHTLALVYQSLEKNSAEGITIGFRVFNMSESRTVKYVRTTWRLFNRVGDEVAGDNSGSAEARVRLTGPIEPMEGAFSEFENLWYSSTGSCAELQGLQVEHIDGTTFSTTTLDGLVQPGSQVKAFGLVLPSVGERGSSEVKNRVKIRGDCSYEAQQERGN